MKKSGRRRWFRLALTLVGLFQIDAEKEKRQIYREQVLPALGGKIPEEAFKSDRLALNRLNKEGISVPDGVLLDARLVQKHPQSIQSMPEIIKVYLNPDGRYVSPEGRFRYNRPKAIDSTYVIRTPVECGGSCKQRGFGGYPDYARHRQFAPTRNNVKQDILKAFITPLVIPAREELLLQSFFPSRDNNYNGNFAYEPLDDYFVNNFELFDSNQIIPGYGLLNEFYERPLRHIQLKSSDRTLLKFSKNVPRVPIGRAPVPVLQLPVFDRNTQRTVLSSKDFRIVFANFNNDPCGPLVKSGMEILHKHAD